MRKEKSCGNKSITKREENVNEKKKKRKKDHLTINPINGKRYQEKKTGIMWQQAQYSKIQKKYITFENYWCYVIRM